MKYRTVLFFLSAFFLLFFIAEPVHVQAKQDLLEVKVTTDKKETTIGEKVTYTITIQNSAKEAWKDVVVTTTLPDELKVLKSDATSDGKKLVWNLDRLDANAKQSVSFVAEVVKASKTGDPVVSIKKDDGTSQEGLFAPKTGDDAKFLPYIILFIVSMIAIAIAVIGIRKKRLRKDAVLLLVIGLSLSAYSVADAKEKKETVEYVHDIIVDGKKVSVHTKVEATVAQPDKIVEDAFELHGKWVKEKDAVGFQLTWQTEKMEHFKVFASEDGKTFQEVTKLEGSKQRYVHTFSEQFPPGGYYYYVEGYQPGVKYRSKVIQSSLEVDSDQDGLSDFKEIALGSDPLKEDTDDDGLPDLYEVEQTLTDPAKKDTDGNGIPDGDEDLDQDGLTNLEELQHNTDPLIADSDADGWNDGYEIQRKTDPLNEDTDNDGLPDGSEEEFGFDPLNPDTNGNGILDGDETVEYTTKAPEMEKDPKIEPSVTIESKAKEALSTKIMNMQGMDEFLTEEIPGYLGAPYDFTTDIDFDEATMTFTYDESVVTDNFRPEIYYYNEEKQLLEKVDNQTHDPSKNQVKAKVSHFSTYLLLNGAEWEKAWEEMIKPPATDDDGNLVHIDVVFSIDSSGSMSWNDPDDLRKDAVRSFVNKLKEKDRAAVVDFDYWATTLVHLTANKTEIEVAIDMIDSSGGTDLEVGIEAAIDELVTNGKDDHMKFIIFLTDGEGYWYNDQLLERAKEHNITIYTIGLGDEVNRELLERIANETGGKYYFASQADELHGVFERTAGDTIDYAIDTDQDGLPDYLEKQGIRLGNGVWIKGLDHTKADTDGDGLKDGEEIVPTYISENGGYFIMHSHPLKVDTDKDHIPDGKEPKERRMVYDVSNRTLLNASLLAYSNMGGNIGQTIDQISIPKAQLDKNPGLKEELSDWRIIDAIDSNWKSVGTGAVALKKGPYVILGYRGTETNRPQELAYDVLLADFILFLMNNTTQVPFAGKFASNIVLCYRDVEVYVTGHSLGGFLAQVVSYQFLEKELHTNYLPFTSTRKALKEKMDQYQYHKKGVTFNAAPFFYAPNSVIKIFTAAVPFSAISSNKYDNDVINYAIQGDFLHLTLEAKMAGKLGKVVEPFEKKLDEDAHVLVQFYEHFVRYY